MMNPLLAIIGFLGTAVFIFYVLFGYPVFLGWWAQRHARPPRRAKVEAPVSIIVCVHNGEAFLANKIQSILALEYPRHLIEILIVSDGSTDGTEAIARSFSSQGVQLLVLPHGGKPAALNAGIRQASGEFLVLTDVRQVLAADSLCFLMENFADPAVGVVSGELVIHEGESREQAQTGLYWRYEIQIRLRLSEMDSIFGASGAYYAMRRELAVPLPPDILLDDMYLPLAAFFRGYRLLVDTRARMFDYPTGLRSEFHRKVRTLAGNYQILRAYPQLLGPGNRLWIHFVSYKLARLFLPFALLAVLISSAALPQPWVAIALLIQAFFYAGALSDPWIPEQSSLKHLTSPIRAFTTLMAAALCAVSIVIRPSATLWKSTGSDPTQETAGGLGRK